MSARTIRRTFAMPVVITLASSCTPMRTSNPPPPTRTPTATSGTPDAKAIEPSGATRRWSISHKSGGQPTECIAQVIVQCPKDATCNPPRPQPYACPDGFAGDEPWNIVMHAGSTTCQVDYGDISCPEGASCNPPPPRELPCPK